MAVAALVLGGQAATPRFKWGQTKDLIFLSVVVRDLNKDSVSVFLTPEGDLSFRAKNAKGEEQVLDLPLREDVEDSLKFEVAPRPDKFGTVVLITLGKVNKHRWDVLVQDPKKFKGLIDKDWSREDQTLEPEEEVPYLEDNSAWLVSLTSKTLDKTLSKFSTVVVNARYPWCSQCKSQDDTFAKAAKSAKQMSKKEPKWKKVAFAVLDARDERKLGKKLGAKCDFNCEYRVYTAKDEEPLPLKAKYTDTELLSAVGPFLAPAVQIIESDSELAALKELNTTCLGSFVSPASPKFMLFKRVAGLMRGEFVFAARFGEDKTLELWPNNQNFSYKYDGTWEDNGTALLQWAQPRGLPLLQPYDWSLRDKYEKLGLPLAKVWLDDSDNNPSFDKVVRHVLRRLAKKYIGKIAFVEQKKTTYSYELRDYALNQPEVYPAFGIASNASYTATKYGFEITPEVAASAQDFWRDTDRAVERLTDFCDQLLAGTWPQAHESGPVHANWTAGQLKKLAWKSYKEILEPQRPLLLELMGKYRSEHERKGTEATNLATALSAHSERFTVASYDTADNYLPPGDFKRDKFSSDTEWYWIPAKASGQARPEAIKLTKPKKDAPIKTVLEFVGKVGGVNVDETMQRFEELMKENPPPAPPPRKDMKDFDPMGGMPPGGMDFGGMGDPGHLGGMSDLGSLAGMDFGGAGEL